MRDRLIAKLPRFFLTLLLAAGLVLTLLGAMDLDFSWGSCLLSGALLAALLEGISWNRRSALWGGAALAAVFLFWLLGGSGIRTLSDLLRAFSLNLSGIPGALPLVASEAAILLTLLFTLLSFFCTRPGAGGVGALLLVIGSLLMLWLSNRSDLMLRLLPAGISALMLLLMDRHQEVSFLRLLPWIAALVLFSFGLTPPSGLVIPELKEKADSLRQSVLDRLFFTEPRDVFSLSTEGFYPQGISQLGGPANPTDHRVMQVSTPKTTYLRGVIMNEYDGRSWRNTLGGRRFLWESGGMAVQRMLLFDQNLPGEGLSSALTASSEVSVRMLADSSSTLFVPQRVRELRAGGELVPYYTNSSELFVTRNLQAGDTWSVSACLFQAGDPGLGTLVDAAAGNQDAQYAGVLETYTTLPSHLEEPVWQMARDITENLSSPYDKAFALQNYLSRNYRYTLDAAIQPSNLDFVTNFLFNTQEGYCTYFASAMTVLCRMAGLPARYVEGYVAEPNASGEALVTGMNAHAWTEVYFQGFGWLTFDATPRQSGGENAEGAQGNADASPSPSAPPEETTTPEPPSNEETPTPSPEEAELELVTPAPEEASSPDPEEFPLELKVSSGDQASFPWFWLILIALASAAAGRWLWTSPSLKARRASVEISRFDLWLEDALLRLSAAGYPRKTGETLMNYTRRLDAEGKLSVPLGKLGECASLLHYGKVTALETDTSLARETALRLKKSLPFRARTKYVLKRFIP